MEEITPELRKWAVEQANVLLQRGHMDDDSVEDAKLRLVQIAHSLTIFVVGGYDEVEERRLVRNVLDSVSIVLRSSDSPAARRRLENAMQTLNDFWHVMEREMRAREMKNIT